MVCGARLVYRTHAAEIACSYCRRTFAASVLCPEGHYVCEDCHGAGFHAFLEKTVLAAEGTDPMAIAEKLLRGPFLPSLGAEHHAIVVAALLAAAKNHGPISLPGGAARAVTDADILEGIRRLRQIPACTCANHGTCGAGLGAGAFISILFDATCAKDVERTLAMRAANAALVAIADCGGPGCCKQSVRTAVLSGVETLKELCRVRLPLSHERCFHIKDTTHGCKGVTCRFSR